jgi:hypothetical protein
VLEHVYNAWDPDVVFDLHTTDGTRHGFHITYAPPLHPNTDPGVMKFTRDELLPGIRGRLARERGWELFDYGNAMGPPSKFGWYTVAPEGRYVTNYVGLRNRISVLSEATSFRPFRDRVDYTLTFVKALLEEISRQAPRVAALSRAADRRMENPAAASEIGVRFDFASRGEEPVPLEVVQPGEKVDRRKAPRHIDRRVLTVYDRFKTTRAVRLPSVYFVPSDLTAVVGLLRRHGARVEKLTQPWRGTVEVFHIDQLHVPSGRFEGHHLTSLDGRFGNRDAQVPPGTIVVRTTQPLGTLVAALLEPESFDGVVTWEFLSGRLKSGAEYPILKSVSSVDATTERLP